MAFRDIFAKFTTQVDTKPLEKAEGLLDRLKAKAQATGRAFSNFGAGPGLKQTFSRFRGHPDGVEVGSAGAAAVDAGGQFTKGSRGIDLWLDRMDAARQSGEGFFAFLAKARRIWGLFGFAAAIAGATVVVWINRLKEAAARMVDVADQVGLSVEQLQVWSEAMVQAGGRAEDMEAILRALTRTAESFGREKTMTAAFKSIGVDPTVAGGLKDMNTLLRETFFGLADMTDATKRAAMAQRIFGKTGAKLIPVLANGRQAAEEFLKRMERMAVVITSEDARALDELGDEMGLLKKQFESFAVKTLVRATDTFRKFVIKMNDAVAHLRALTQHSQIFTSAWLISGGKALQLLTEIGIRFGLWRGALSALGFVVRKVLLPFLILDDILVWLKGGRSLLGEWIDFFFGKGTQFEWAAAIRNFLTDLPGMLKRSVSAGGPLNKLFNGLKQTGSGLAEMLAAFGRFVRGEINFSVFALQFADAMTEVVFGLGKMFGEGVKFALSGGLFGTVADEIGRRQRSARNRESSIKEAESFNGAFEKGDRSGILLAAQLRAKRLEEVQNAFGPMANLPGLEGMTGVKPTTATFTVPQNITVAPVFNMEVDARGGDVGAIPAALERGANSAVNLLRSPQGAGSAAAL